MTKTLADYATEQVARPEHALLTSVADTVTEADEVGGMRVPTRSQAPAVGLTDAQIADGHANAWPATGDLVIVTAGFTEPDDATYRIAARLDGGRLELTDTATGETGYASAWQLAPAGA